MDKLADFRPPFRIAFLLVDGFALMSFAAVSEPLRAANLLAGKKLYEISIVPASGPRATSSSGAVIRATTQLGERVDFNLVLVVAGGDPASFNDRRVLQWLRHLASRGVSLGGVSGGPVILALAGVMNSRRMTVHWEHADVLAQLAPGSIIERSLYVIDRDRMTCAGGIAPLDMMHALLTAHHGEKFPGLVSDWFMHTQVRPSGGPQRAGLVERYGVTSKPLVVAIELMTNHIAGPLSLDQLALLANISARQLNRLFKKHLKTSAMAFYRNLRLEKADSLIRTSPFSLTEIALATGFSSSAHFSASYRAKYGLPPSAAKR